MRRGEILKLRWDSVNFTNKTITVVAMNTKTARARNVALTDRLRDELQELWQKSTKDQNGLVFGITDSFKKSFNSACKEAEIEDLHFHDLRHTAITRLINLGIAPMEIMKISGHTQMNTFTRYINPEASSIQNIAKALSDSYKLPTIEIEESRMVN
jgi:integrase